MLLQVVSRGKVLSKVKFWKERDSVEMSRVSILVGANGTGKTATLDAIAAYYGAFNASARDNYLDAGLAIEEIGSISLDREFSKVLRYRGSSLHVMPATIGSEEDFTLFMHRQVSHGEAGIYTLHDEIFKPIEERTRSKCLILLDEIEAGLSAEAQTLFGKRLHRVATRNLDVTVLVATQSDRIRNELMRDGLATDYDFGGWLIKNPFTES